MREAWLVQWLLCAKGSNMPELTNANSPIEYCDFEYCGGVRSSQAFKAGYSLANEKQYKRACLNSAIEIVIAFLLGLLLGGLLP